jgi:hypothetical protein
MPSLGLSMDYFSTKALAAFPANGFGNQLGAFDVSLQSIAVSNSIQQFNWAIGGSGALLGFCLDMIAPLSVGLLLE